mmetsp:Transcript_14946/g.37236  ORF Transcript_14946/g.37236 Transcript_14946/m.37236 type:complete len:586 (-) Transcript_14946:241-1998(-)
MPSSKSPPGSGDVDSISLDALVDPVRVEQILRGGAHTLQDGTPRIDTLLGPKSRDRKMELDVSRLRTNSGGDGDRSPTLSTTRSLFGGSDPFALMDKSLNRHLSAKSKRDLRLFKDPQDPRCHEYYKSRFPDFDEFLACLESVDYKYECEHDARFADKYRIPPTQEPVCKLEKGHLKGVDSCVWLGTEGKRFVSGGHDGVRVWAEGCGPAHTGGIGVAQSAEFLPSYDISVSGDQKFILSGGPCIEDFPETRKGTLAVYSLENATKGKPALSLRLQSTACGMKGNVHTVDLLSGSSAGMLALAGDSTGRTTVVDLQRNSAVWAWDTHCGYTDPRTYIGTGSAVTGAKFCQTSPNVFATGGKDGHVRLWDMRVSQQRGFWLTPSSLANRVSMKTCVELLFAHERQPVLGLNWLDSATLLTCGGDNKAKKWDLRMPEMNGQVSEAFLGHIAPVRGVSASPDGKWVSTACEDGSARIFRLNDLNIRRQKLRTVLEKRKRLEGESDPDVRARMRHKYTETAKSMTLEVHRIKQDGFSDGVVSLIGHSLAVSQVSWIKDPHSARPDRYRLLTASWDQTCNIHDVDLAERD